jgi:hypothetical protein
MATTKTKRINPTFKAALVEAHGNGRHQSAETGAIDASGYWREQGCPACIRAHENAETRAEDYGIKDVKFFEDLHLRVWTLFEPKSRLPRVWTVLIFEHNPERDTVIDSSGTIQPGNMNTPAGIWERLSQEYGKMEQENKA